MVPLEGSTALGTKNLKKISPTPLQQQKKKPGAMKHHHPSQGFFKRYIFRGHNFEKFAGSLANFPILLPERHFVFIGERVSRN
jgi:hypothetical protein